MKLKKRLFRALSLAVISAILLASASTSLATAPPGVTIWGYQEGLAKAEKDGLFGFANAQGQIVVPIQYNSALNFSLGLAQVELTHRLGVIRQDGTYLIEPAYGTLIHMSSGLFIAQKGDKWGVVSILPFPDEHGGTTNVLYDFQNDSATLELVGGVDTLTLTQGQVKTLVPLFQISALLLQKNVPSACFPLRQGVLPSFSDVTARDWYALWVDLAYNLDLMEGVGGSKFAPNKILTVAESLKLAASMESRYRGDDFQSRNVSGPNWYRPAADYCIASGIIKSDEFTDFTRPITRAEMASIFAATSLGKSIPAINSLDRIKTALPDVPADSHAADAIYSLYAKGILTGTNRTFSFSPEAHITRAEVAAVVSRMARAEQRVILWPTSSAPRSVTTPTPAPQETTPLQ